MQACHTAGNTAIPIKALWWHGKVAEEKKIIRVQFPLEAF